MPVDWEAIRKHARLDARVPDTWPRSVKAISLEGVQLLGLDDDNRLYWDGQEIVVRRRLDLSVWQRIGAVLAVLAAIAAGGGTLVQAGMQAVDFGCARHAWPHWCVRGTSGK